MWVSTLPAPSYIWLCFPSWREQVTPMILGSQCEHSCTPDIGQHRWCCSFTTAALTPEKAILNSAQSRSQQELSAGEQVLLGVQICSMLTLLTILHALKYFKNTFTLLIKLMENSGFLIYSVLSKVLHETVTLWKRTPWLYITVEKNKTVQVSSESQLPVKSPVQFIKQID